MSIELQELDCNCSNCGYFSRSLSKRQKHVDFHYDLQKSYFNTKRIKLIGKGEWRIKNGDKEKAKLILKEARKMVFAFDEGQCSLHFGLCKKFNKDVTFISNTCQLNTQECFIHRSKPLI